MSLHKIYVGTQNFMRGHKISPIGGILCPHTKFSLCYIGEIFYVPTQNLCGNTKFYEGTQNFPCYIGEIFYVPTQIFKILCGGHKISPIGGIL